MVIRWLKDKLLKAGRLPANGAGNFAALPSDVQDSMRDGIANKISGFVDWASSQANSKELFGSLLAQAKEFEWNSGEFAKLQAYISYFARRYQEAYDAAIPFLSDTSFDSDYFGIASMALFNTNQFDRAYALLRDIKKNEHLLIGNLDFQIAAALICWSAGDRYRANRYIDLGTCSGKPAGMMIFNALAMYFELNDEAGYQRTVSALTDSDRQQASFQFSLGFLELAKNNYQSGFLMMESRYEMPEAYRYMRNELLAMPRWQRESIEDKTLLIHGEQGLGDMIQTARFFDDCLKAAGKVIVECPAESIALLEHNFPAIHFVPLSQEKPLSEAFDIWTGTLSLPFIFNIGADSVPGRAGYLQVPPDHAAYWRDSVKDWGRPGAVKVGVAWSGYPGHRADHRRSVPWEMFRYLLEQYPAVDFFAVQIKVPDDLPPNLHDCTEEMITLSDTVGLINEMDLIITVDTSVVHMAGAIGKEAWMMLPYRYEWRWGLEGEENPWYDSVKVIRQPAPGAWAPVLSNVFGQRFREFLRSKERKS